MRFSGHESFYCKSFWLKKGYDYIVACKNFNDDDAVIELGVGKNMVSAIKHWLKAFDLIDIENKPTEFADKIFSDFGFDPYLENTNTLWLLHYNLVSNEFATIYSLVYNKFRKEYFEFKKNQLFAFLRRECENVNFNYNENTLNTDISVFLRTYLKPERNNNVADEDYSSLLIDLNLVSVKSKAKTNQEIIYSFEIDSKDEIADEVLLYIICEKYENQNTIDFNELFNSYNSIGSIFCFTRAGLINKLEKIARKYPFIVFSDDAGIKQIQIKGELPNKWDVLNTCFHNN